jgi:hypothetical protein
MADKKKIVFGCNFCHKKFVNISDRDEHSQKVHKEIAAVLAQKAAEKKSANLALEK